MSTPTAVTFCQCCGNNRPPTSFAPGAITCAFCVEMRPDDITRATAATVNRDHAIATHTKAGRKAERIALKMVKYGAAGKRCSGCHHPKPPEAYNKCAPQPDGLQPICRACNEIRAAALKSGGLAAWHTIRAALRAASPEGK